MMILRFLLGRYYQFLTSPVALQCHLVSFSSNIFDSFLHLTSRLYFPRCKCQTREHNLRQGQVQWDYLHFPGMRRFYHLGSTSKFDDFSNPIESFLVNQLAMNHKPLHHFTAVSILLLPSPLFPPPSLNHFDHYHLPSENHLSDSWRKSLFFSFSSEILRSICCCLCNFSLQEVSLKTLVVDLDLDLEDKHVRSSPHHLFSSLSEGHFSVVPRQCCRCWQNCLQRFWFWFGRHSLACLNLQPHRLSESRCLRAPPCVQALAGPEHIPAASLLINCYQQHEPQAPPWPLSLAEASHWSTQFYKLAYDWSAPQKIRLHHIILGKTNL